LIRKGGREQGRRREGGGGREGGGFTCLVADGVCALIKHHGKEGNADVLAVVPRCEIIG